MRDNGKDNHSLSLIWIEWYEAISGWKEFSLGLMEEDQEEVINIPGSCSSCLMQQLIQLCHYLDEANELSNNVISSSSSIHV